LLRESGWNRIVDLASGGGGPWPELVEELASALGEPPTVILTDIQPNQTAATELERLPGVTYLREPCRPWRSLPGSRVSERSSRDCTTSMRKKCDRSCARLKRRGFRSWRRKRPIAPCEGS